MKNQTNVKLYSIIEIMVTRSDDELKLIREAYLKRYEKDLDKEFQSKSIYS